MFSDEMKQELQLVAKEIEVDPFCLMAVVQVESGGRYFAHVDGRKEPVIRFEGHYFYRLLSKAKRNKAVVAGLANARAGRIRNPLSQGARWSLLGRASKIDRGVALSSTSWGVGQVMGVHWRWLGYASIDAMVSEVRSGLAGQVRLMARFIKKAGLAENLRSKDWAGFARAYNGPGYHRNKYDVKMAMAYEKYSTGNGEYDKTSDRKKQRHSKTLLRPGSRGPAVMELQNQLGALGFQLARDGDFGPATCQAVKLFQKSNRLQIDGVVGPKTFEMMMRKMPVHSL